MYQRTGTYIVFGQLSYRICFHVKLFHPSQCINIFGHQPPKNVDTH